MKEICRKKLLLSGKCFGELFKFLVNGFHRIPTSATVRDESICPSICRFDFEVAALVGCDNAFIVFHAIS